MNTLLISLPNLLDSRVPDGDGENDNQVVAEWGQQYIKSGEVGLTMYVLARILKSGFYVLILFFFEAWPARHWWKVAFFLVGHGLDRDSV